MAQKVIDIVGVSKESFAKAAENAVAQAAKTVRGLKWGRGAEFAVEIQRGESVRHQSGDGFAGVSLIPVVAVQRVSQFGAAMRRRPTDEAYRADDFAIFPQSDGPNHAASRAAIFFH